MREPGYYWVLIKGYQTPHVLRHFHEQGKGYWQDNYRDSDLSYIALAPIALPLDLPVQCDQCQGRGELYYGCPLCVFDAKHSKCDSQYSPCECRKKK